MAQVNDYSFLKWYDQNPTVGLPKVPYAYWNDREACAAAPIGLPTESLSFYINIKDGIPVADLNISGLRLALVRVSDGFSFNNIATLQSHVIDPPDNAHSNIYATVIIPASKVGFHYFKIYQASGGAEVYRSSYILVRTDQQVLYNTTSYCRFRHDREFYNIKYGSLPGFHQQFRLGVSVSEEQNEGDKETYFEITTGKPRTYQNYMNKITKMETYYFDRDGHEAAAVMFDHSEIWINGRRYYPKAVYKRNVNPKSKINKGEIDMYEEDFSSVNRCAS